MKMAEHLLLYNDFNVKHDGSIDFLINQKTFVQESIKVSFFSRQEKNFPNQESNPGLQITSRAC